MSCLLPIVVMLDRAPTSLTEVFGAQVSDSSPRAPAPAVPAAMVGNLVGSDIFGVHLAKLGPHLGLQQPPMLQIRRPRWPSGMYCLLCKYVLTFS